MRKVTLDGVIVALVTVCLLAEIALVFITGFPHSYVLGLRYGETGVDARLGPVALDLPLLTFALVSLLLARKGRRGWRDTWQPRLYLAAGAAGTIAANAAYGAIWGWTGGMLAIFAPVMMFMTVEAGMVALRVMAEEAEKAAKAAEAPRLKRQPDYSEADEIASRNAEELAKLKARQGEWFPEGKEPAPQGLTGIGIMNGGR